MIQKVESALCLFCNGNVIDSVEHTIAFCNRWIIERDTLIHVIGPDLRLEAIIDKMLESREKWAAIVAFARRVMLTKENEERPEEAG